MMRLLFTMLMLLPAAGLFAQTTDEDKESKKRGDKPAFGRWYGGGNFGLQFGNPTLINLSPIVGYRLTEQWSVGTGINYTYYKFKYTSTDVLETSIYGGSLFTRYQIFESFFLQLEDEALNGDVYDPNTGDFKREWINSVMVGGGLIQPLGNGGLTVQGMYILNYDPNRSFYNTPFVFRMGFFLF